MKIMRIPVLLFLAVISTPLFAAVTAQVDKNPLLAGETVTLTIRSESGKGEPDLSALEADFQVLGRRSSSQIRMINGTTTRTHDWLIQLRPKRLGELRIPPISVGQERTAAINLTVKKPDMAQGELPEAYIEFETDKSEAWLREQITLTARLYVRGDLLSGSFSEPTSTNAVIEQLGDQRESQQLRGTHRYRVIERRYAIFAEQSGTLELNGPVFSGEVADTSGRSQGLFGFGTPSRSLYAAADPLSIDIKSPPNGASDWMPAHDVQLSQTITPADGPWQVGQPLTRTVTLKVFGQLHTQLPDFSPALPPNSQSFTEPPQEQTQSDGQQLIATRSYSTAIIPGPGDNLVLPEVSIDWWDTLNSTFRTATLPQRTLKLIGAAPTTAPPPQPPSAVAPTSATQNASASVSEPPAGGVDWRWQVATYTCAAGWLGTLLAWLWQTRRRERPQRIAQDSFDKRNTLKTLQTGDARACRQALLNWSKEVHGQPLRLDQLPRLSNDAALPAALSALDDAAFGSGETFPRQPLITLVREYRPAARPSSSSALPPLYPE